MELARFVQKKSIVYSNSLMASKSILVLKRMLSWVILQKKYKFVLKFIVLDHIKSSECYVKAKGLGLAMKNRLEKFLESNNLNDLFPDTDIIERCGFYVNECPFRCGCHFVAVRDDSSVTALTRRLASHMIFNKCSIVNRITKEFCSQEYHPKQLVFS